MDITEYIKSGMLEAYLSGTANEAEVDKLLYLKARHPEIDDALYKLEVNIETLTRYTGITPPPVQKKLEDYMKELFKNEKEAVKLKVYSKKIGDNNHKSANTDQFVEVRGSSTHIRVHKMWRWIFLGVFIIGKIFLGFAIYYYLEYRQIKEQMEKQHQEVREIR